jgi:hypothetical protein
MTNKQSKTLNTKDFEAAFGEPVSEYVSRKIQQHGFEYSDFTFSEYENLLLTIVKAIFEMELVKAGIERHDQWESGWEENFEKVAKDSTNFDSLIPRYFGKYSAVRWNGKLIKPLSEKFEYHTLGVLLDWVFDKYLRKASRICEFGCGSGHNLLRAREVNSTASIVGLDWAQSSQKIVEFIAKSTGDRNMTGENFNYFDPNYDFKVNEDTFIYTVASLEQIGGRWQPFVKYLLKNKPSLCIHIEPIGELLNSDVLIDWLSIKYFEKRNYLSGFMTGLRELESKGEIEIISAQRTNVGSLFIEGYSLIIWRPI